MGRKKYKGRRVAAFIFDLDGTLIDSGLDIAKSANFVRVHFGRPELPETTLIGYIGDGVGNLMLRTLGHGTEPPGEDTVKEGLAVFRDHYERHCLDNTGLYPGVLDVLARYRQFPLMIATNKPRCFTDQILQGLHIESAFRCVVADEDVPERKPHPASLLLCLAGLDVPREEVVVVGDHANDIQAAQAIGAVSVGVSYGLTPAGLIRSAGPDYVIDEFRDLFKLFPSR